MPHAQAAGPRCRNSGDFYGRLGRQRFDAVVHCGGEWAVFVVCVRAVLCIVERAGAFVACMVLLKEPHAFRVCPYNYSKSVLCRENNSACARVMFATKLRLTSCGERCERCALGRFFFDKAAVEH